MKLGRLASVGIAFCLVVSGCQNPEPVLRLGEATVVYEDALRTDDLKREWGGLAIETLSNVLAKVTGRSVRTIPESQFGVDSGSVVYLGDTEAAKRGGIDASKLLAAEFRLKVVGPRAFLVGRTGMATSYAVTEFVQRFTDYRFLTICGDGDPYTVNSNAVAKALDVTIKPRIYDLRSPFWSDRYKETASFRDRWLKRIRGYSNAAYSSRTEIDSRRKLSARPGFCHSQFAYCPPKLYFKEHPEYYAVCGDGKRHAEPVNSQLCFSNPDVFKICLASLKRFIAEDRRENPTNYPCIYDFSQMDCSLRLCQCAECSAVAKKYDRHGGFRDGGDAGLQLQFVNRLAWAIREKYPDVRIRTFAYNSTEEVPQGIVPEENVIIWLCDLYTRSDHTLPLTHPFNVERRRILGDWQKIAHEIQLWDYELYGGTWEGDYPEVFADASASDVRFFESLGFDSVYFQTLYERQPFYELNTYVLMQLAFGPDRPVDELIDEGCRVYGRAALEMKRAIDFLRKIIAANPPENANAWHNRLLPWRTIENWETFLAIVRPAYDTAESLPAKRRIAAVLASTYKELAKLCKGREEKTALFDCAKKEYPRFAREALELSPVKKSEYERDRQSVENFFGLLDLSFSRLPEELKNVPRKDLLFYDWRQISYLPASELRVVEDRESEVGKALKAVLILGNAVNGFDAKIMGMSFTPQAQKVKVPNDGAYHWRRIGECSLPRMADVRLGGIRFPLAEAYIECDGLENNPNRCEIWMSVKLKGNEKSKADDEGLFVDRAILRRL